MKSNRKGRSYSGWLLTQADPFVPRSLPCRQRPRPIPSDPTLTEQQARVHQTRSPSPHKGKAGGFGWAMGLMALGWLGAWGCQDWPWADRFAQRRAKVASMSRLQKAHLLQTRLRLEALSPAEQEHLRQLNRQIEADPQADLLRRIAQRYYAWLKTLPLYRRAELQEMPPSQRVEAIQKAIEEASVSSVRRPRPEDAKALWEWMEAYAQRHEAAIVACLPPERKQEWQSDPEHRRRLVMSFLWRPGPSPHPNLPRPTPQELDALYRSLSPESRDRLLSLSPETQWKLIASWARYLVHYQGDRATGWIPPEVSGAELLHFLEYELSAEQIDTLLALPPEQMLQELRQLYFRIKIPQTEEPSGQIPETALPLGP